MTRERRMNPKCQTRPELDTLGAISADSTGLFSMPITRAASFDHLVGARKKVDRWIEAEHFGGLQIDDELVLGRKLDWQVTRNLALENAINVGRGTARELNRVYPVGGQATCRDEVLEPIDRR